MSLLQELDDFVNRSKTNVGWLEPRELLEYADRLIAESAKEIRTMSNKRIINFDDAANGAPQGPQQPQGPTTMEDLLNSAQTDWKFKRKDEAFIKVLGALAMMSAGVAQAMKTAELAHKEVEELKAKLAKE